MKIAYEDDFGGREYLDRMASKFQANSAHGFFDNCLILIQVKERLPHGAHALLQYRGGRVFDLKKVCTCGHRQPARASSNGAKQPTWPLSTTWEREGRQ